MPDYNLGRAHGTIRIDYDKSGAKEAKDDIGDIGDEAARSSKKIDDSNKETGRSYRRLGEETKRTKTSPDVDQSAWSELLQNIRGIQSNTRTTSSVLNTFSGRLKLIVAGVAVLAPQIAGLAVSLASLAGLAGVAAGALAGLGAVGATVATGISGVGAAFKAASAQAGAAGGSAGASAKAQRAAARTIEDAKRSLEDAEKNLQRTQEDAARAAIQAARQVVTAQRDLINAQRDAARAQESLNRAREQAVRDLEDMQFALRGGSLDERQAILDVKKAQEDLNKVLADPTANADNIEEATIQLQRQQLALDKTRQENERLATDQAAASAAGVEGSNAVVSAQDSVRSATEGVADAQQSLADAQDNVRQVQIDSARQIADAVQGVIDAQRNLADAYTDAADAGGAAGAKLNDALANLSPNARAFVKEVIGLKGAWDEVRKSVQDKLFAGLAAEVKPLAQQWFPLLKEGMGKVATSLNGIVKETVAYLHTAEAQKNVANIFDNTGKALGNLRTVVRDLLAAFLDIASVGSDFLPDMATGAANAASRFRDFISAAKESGKLKEWMQGGIDTLKQIWQLLKNVGSIIGSVFSAFDQEGGGALNTLTKLTGQIAAFLKTAEGQNALHALGRILASIGGAVGKVFMSFLAVAADLLVRLEPLIVAFADAAGVYLAGALQVLGAILKPIADIFGFLGPSLGPVIAGIYAMNKAVEAAKVVWGLLNGVMKSNPFIQIAAVIITLALLIIQNWDAISAFLTATWTTIRDFALGIWDHIKSAIIDPIVDVWLKIVEIWDLIKNVFSTAGTEIWNSVVGMWNNIKNAFSSASDTTKQIISTFINNTLNIFRNMPGQIWDFVKSLPDKFLTLGQDIISGIVRGLGNFAGKIWDKFKSIISNAWNNVLDFFGVNSPSKEGIFVGEMIGRGLAMGIDRSTSEAVNAAASMAAAVGNELTGASGTLATSVDLSGKATAVPANLSAAAAVNNLTTAATPAATAARGGDGAKMVVVNIDNLVLKVAGNLDPTNPTAYRQTIVRLKDAVRNLDKEYA